MKEFCCYCGCEIKHPLISTTEHLVPISKGGNNRLVNKRRCCKRCNTWRGNKSLDRFKMDVIYYLENNFTKAGYSKLDLECMIENIDYINEYIASSNGRLLKREL